MSSPTTKDPLTLMAMWGSMKGYNPGQGFSFEGPEKRLEVIVRFLPETHKDGLHSLDDDVWAGVVGSLNAQIVSKEKNEFIKSYVLTESSLFVMKNRILLITCGTTTLLNSVPAILEAISAVRAELEWVSFMHKNYSFPWEQKGPHTSLADEFTTLKQHFPTGKPYIFGPVDSDHYFLFCYDDIIRPCSTEDDTQLSMTMYDLDTEQTKHWFSDCFISTSEETAAIRRATHLDRVVDDSWTLHDLQFEPCGYSVNAIRGEEYQTMHITPEDHCSFASYETNSKAANYSDRMNKVLGVFRPQRFTVIVFIDPESAVGRAYHSGIGIGVEPENYPEYHVLHRTVNEFAPGYVAMKINYVMKSAIAEAQAKKASGIHNYMWRHCGRLLCSAAPGASARRPYGAVLRALEHEGRGLLAAAGVFRQFESFYRLEMQSACHAATPVSTKPLTKFCGDVDEVEPFTVLLLKVLCDLQKLEEMRFLFTQCVLEATDRPPSIELFNVYLLAISMTDTFNQNEIENIVDLMRARGVAPDVVTKVSILILYLRLGQDNSSDWWPMIRDEVQAIVDTQEAARYPLLPLRILHCFQTVVRLHHDTTMTQECFLLLCAIHPDAVTPALLLPYMVLGITNDAMPPSAVVEVLAAHERQQSPAQRDRDDAGRSAAGSTGSHDSNSAAAGPTPPVEKPPLLLNSETTAFRLLSKCAKWKDASAARFVREYLSRHRDQERVIAPAHEPLAALLHLAALTGSGQLHEAFDLIERELPMPYNQPGPRPKLFLQSRRVAPLSTDPVTDFVRQLAKGGADGIERVLASMEDRTLRGVRVHSSNSDGGDGGVAATAPVVTSASLDLLLAACAELHTSEGAEKVLLVYSAFAAEPTAFTYACLLRSYSSAPAQGVVRLRSLLPVAVDTGMAKNATFLRAAMGVALSARDVGAALMVAEMSAAAGVAVETRHGTQLLRELALVVDEGGIRRAISALRASKSVVNSRSVDECAKALRLWNVPLEDLTRL